MSSAPAWKSFEQEIARKLRDIGIDAKRNWDEQFVQSTGADIITPEYIFQLKYSKVGNADLRHAYDEANNTAINTSKGKKKGIGVVRDRKTSDTLVVMSWKTFYTLLQNVQNKK